MGGETRIDAPSDENSRDVLDLPFDQYQRYRLIQQVAEAIELAPGSSVLDVGGYPGLIHHFFSDYDATIVDLVDAELPNYVKYDGKTLPFGNDAFDLACSCDVLEHVPPDGRPGFLNEMARVARTYLVVTAPFYDERTRLAEEILYNYIKRVLRQEHPVLREHLVNGLPDLRATVSALESYGWRCVTVPSGYLYRWLPMMMVKHQMISYGDTAELHRRLDRLYNLEFGDRDYVQPSYRRAIFASRGDDTNKVMEMFQRARRASEKSEPDLFDLFARLQDNNLHLRLEDHLADDSGKVLLRQIDELHQQLNEARQRYIEQQGHIDNLEVELGRSFAYRIWLAGRKLFGR